MAGKKINKIVLLVMVIINSKLCCFLHLHQWNEYISQHVEKVMPDNQDWDDLDYSSYHKSLYPNILQYAAHTWLGIKNQQLALVEDLETLLKKVILIKKKHVASAIAFISCTQNSQFAVMTDLQGSLHTLVRVLNWAHEHNVIDENLKIIDPDFYFVFNGNSINRSAYSIETLYLILLLTLYNPKNIVHVAGAREYDNNWYNFSLKRELQQRALHVSSELIPMKSLVNDYFGQLIHALYISTTDSPLELIKIVHSSPLVKNNDEALFGDFLINCHKEKIAYYDLSQPKVKSVKIPDLKVVITTPGQSQEAIIKRGIGVLEPEQGAHTWGLYSSPVYTGDDKLEFFFDSFAFLNIKNNLKLSTITLFNHDVNVKDQFFKKEFTYNLETGLKVDAAHAMMLPTTDFFIGSTMGFEKNLISMSKRIKQGMLIRIKELNEAGGVNGIQLRAILKNDDYLPYVARKNIENLFKDYKITTFLLPTGSPTLSAYLDYVTKNNLLVLFPITGSSAYRAPDIRDIINYRASYEDEVNNLLQYIRTEYYVKNFAFFYQDDSYGMSALKAAKKLLKDEKGITILEIPYKLNETSFAAQIAKLNQMPIDAIGFFSSSGGTQEFIRQVGVEYLAPKKLFGLSFLGEESFRTFLKREGVNMLFASVVPDPYKSQLQIVKNYRAAMKNNFYDSYDVFSLEAYISTSIFIDVLAKIDQPITNEKIIRQLQGMHNYHYQGLTLTFNPQTRSLSNDLWIEDANKPEWVKCKIEQTFDKK